MKAGLWLAMVVWVTGEAAAAVPTWERTILLPGVEGRVDHLGYDASGDRLFVAALGNNTVEVVDLKQGRVVHSITGLSEPQGVLYLGRWNRLYVANGGDGTLRVFDGTAFALQKVLPLGDDADNVRYDDRTGIIYVGHGRGALALVDANTGVVAGEIALGAHPESFQLERGGQRLFVNLPGAHELGLVDRGARRVIGHWDLGLDTDNFPMALDETHHRLFVSCRVPACLIIFDTDTGRKVAQLALHRDCDDLFYDASRRQIYASCGEGYVDVFVQDAADRYAVADAVATAPGARTSWFDGRQHLYVAVPRRNDQVAEIHCYRLTP